MLRLKRPRSMYAAPANACGFGVIYTVPPWMLGAMDRRQCNMLWEILPLCTPNVEDAGSRWDSPLLLRYLVRLASVDAGSLPIAEVEGSGERR